MNDNLPRRNVLASVLAAMTLPAGFALAAMPAPVLRGDDTARLPDHAALWARMPLPFTPAEAWHLLSPATQAEIGAAAIGMHLAQYVHGDSMSALYEHAERRGREPHGPTLLRLVRRWLAIHGRIATLLPGVPEPPHVQEVRGIIEAMKV